MRCNPCEVLGSLSPGIGVDGRISLIGQVNNSGPGAKGFRSSVEVAWDKDEGGVFVQRFGMEPDERRPRWVHMPPKPALWM